MTFFGKKQDILTSIDRRGGASMLGWVILFFILAAIAAVLGFGGMSGIFVSAAKFLAVIFVILFLSSLVYHLLERGKRPPLA